MNKLDDYMVTFHQKLHNSRVEETPATVRSLIADLWKLFMSALGDRTPDWEEVRILEKRTKALEQKWGKA